MPTMLYPKTVDYVAFEAACDDLVAEVEQTSMSIVITKDGRPYAVLTPPQPETAKSDESKS
jgi:antitoxin (DNA-binding transcriptional repressor) of toxin-antitoxin stability system